MFRLIYTAFNLSGDLEPISECIGDLFLSTLLVVALVKLSTRAPTLITISAWLFQWTFDSWFAYRQAIARQWSRPATIMLVAFTTRWVLFLFALSSIYQRRERIRALSLLSLLRDILVRWLMRV